jgi:hypothetical protein
MRASILSARFSSMTTNDVTVPLWDSVTRTCARFGFSRTYFHTRIRHRVEVRKLEKKLLVRQIGPRSVEEIYASLPTDEEKAEQDENLAHGTALSQRRAQRRRRRGR